MKQKKQFRLLFGLVFFLACVSGFYYRVRLSAQPIIVAVLDTGVNLAAPGVAGQIQPHVTELQDNGTDDDQNGFVDDVYGWNFFDNNADIRDENGHGTGVASLIVRGSSVVRVLPVKMIKNSAGMRPEDLAKGIRYAVGRGAKIIQMSFGMSTRTDELDQAIREAASKGVILVAAAGVGLANPFEPMNLSQVYPQAYSEVIVIGAANSPSQANPISNFGKELEVVALPTNDQGQYIPGNEKAIGSSFAAAKVTGAIAHRLSTERKLTSEQIRMLLRKTAAPVSESTPLRERFGRGIFDQSAFLTAN